MAWGGGRAFEGKDSSRPEKGLRQEEPSACLGQALAGVGQVFGGLNP